MRRLAFPLILAGTFAVAALGAHAAGGNAPTRIVDVDHDDRFETPGATETPDPSATPDAPDDSDRRTDDDDSGPGGGGEDRSGSNSGKG